MKEKRREACAPSRMVRPDTALAATNITEPLEMIVLFLVVLGVVGGVLVPVEASAAGARLTLDLLIWLAAGCAILNLVLRGGESVASFRITTIELAFFALLVTVAFSAFNASYKHAAITRLLAWSTRLAIGFLGLHLCRRPAERRILFGALAATAIVVALHGFHQRFLDIPEAREAFQRDPEGLLRRLGLPPEMRAEFQGRLLKDRPFSTFVLPTSLAGFLALVTPAWAGFAVARWRAMRRPFTKFLNLAALGALVVCLFLTGSKGGWMAFGVGVAAFLALGVRHWLAQRWRVFFPAAILTGIAAGYLLAARFPPMQEFVGSLKVRMPYWKASLQMIRARPLLGVGPGAWEDYYCSYKTAADQETRMAHNDYLQVAAEMGVVTLATYLTVWAVILWCAWPRSRPYNVRTGDESSEGSSKREMVQGDAQFSNEPTNRLPVLLGLCGGTVAFLVELTATHTFCSSRGVFYWLWPVALWLVWCAFYLYSAMPVGSDAATDAPATVPDWRFLQVGVLSGLLAFLAHGLVDFDLHVDGTAQTAFFLAGAALAFTGEVRTLGTFRPGLAGRVLVVAVVFIFLLSLSVGVIGPMTRADSLYETARQGMLAGNMTLEQQLQLLETAARLDRKNPRIQGALGEAFFALAGNPATPAARRGEAFTQAVAHVTEAARLRPQTHLYPRQLGQMYEWLGGISHGTVRQDALSWALRHYRQARERFQSNPHLVAAVARVSDTLGLRKEAIENYRRALELDEIQYHHTRARLPWAERQTIEKRLRALGEYRYGG